MALLLFRRAALLCALVAVVGSPVAPLAAQEVILRAPGQTDSIEIESPEMDAFPDAFPEAQPPLSEIEESRSGCGTPAYWLVGSRHCTDTSAAGICRCPLRFYGAEADGRLHISDQQSFLAGLKPQAPVCILVHGSFHTFESVANGSRELYRWLQSSPAAAEGTIVFFTWPSDNPNTMVLPVDFAILGQRSAMHGAHLSRLITLIPADHPVSLVGHSHGARAVSSALHLRAGGEVEGICLGCAPDFGRRIRVVFAAAAIDNHWLNPGERYGLALRGTEYLVTLTNRDDSALGWYPFRRLFSHEALARTGFTPINKRALGPWTARLAEIDVTRQIGRGHLWHNYTRHPEIAQAIAPTLFYWDPGVADTVKADSQIARPTSHQPKPRVNYRESPRQDVRETFANFGRTAPLGNQ